MSYVDTGVDGWTELRVHGVSGTTAEALLDHPNVTRVAGNASAGFYRRRWEAEGTAGDSAGRRVEAYTWGGLTSGDWTRALWLLLLPFMLLNVAFYMTPASPLGESRGWRRLRGVSESVQRLLALTLTVTFALTAVTAVMDLSGWQCARVGTQCAAPWQSFYSWPWLAEAGRLLAVSSLVPIALVTLLWRFAHRSWAAAENVTPPAAPAVGTATWQTPLEDRAFWNGRGPVARLRSLHIGTAYAVIGLFLAVPMLPRDTLATRRGPLTLASSDTWSAGPVIVPTLVFGFVALIAVSFAWVAFPSLGRRERPSSGGPAPMVNRQRTVVAVALVMLAGTWFLALFSEGALGTPVRERAASGLPWLASTTIALFGVQVALLVVFGVLTVVQARWHPRRRLGAPVIEAGPGGKSVQSVTAWHGLGAPVFAGISWALACGLSAAVTVRLADVLGTPLAPQSSRAGINPDYVILLPVEYFWAAAATVPVLLIVILGGLAVMIRARRIAGDLAERVLRSYAGRVAPETLTVDAPRTRTIAAVWARATITEQVRSVMIVLAGTAGTVLGLGIVGRLAEPDWVVTSAPRFLIPAGGFVMTALVLGLLWVGRRAYADARFRRTVGILWDLGTFWPRATHPLAPPCYAERTVPDLLGRIEHLRANGGRVVLSCHSQGTVIGAATVAAMTYEALGRTAFLTYGSPLRRLYARFFPAYFGVDQLLRIGDLLWRGTAGADDVPSVGAMPRHRASGQSPDTRRLWPWINLHRRSDPIGGPMLVSNPPFAGGAELTDLDCQLLDPAYDRPPGDSVDPEPLGHSGYQHDLAFAAALLAVRDRREATVIPTPLAR